jgi:hypothetical protein
VKRHHTVTILAWILTAAWALAMVSWFWPHNEVSFPKGNVATVEPTIVPELGTITVTFPAYCNNGQVVTVTRWADIYEAGRRTASEQLGALTFYPAPDGPTCLEPRVDEIGLTTAFQAYQPGGTTYRIRSVTAYRPALSLRPVTVEASTQPFLVTAN